MSPARLTRRRTWEEHERRVLGIFGRALMLLASEASECADEDNLNRRLHSCVRKANGELVDQGKGIDFPVMYEACNQPDADDEAKAARESKRPDFQWGFVDFDAPDPQRRDKFYVIECKRLGEPRGKSWVFNRNYVQQGILRFVNAEHGYGKSMPSGAMVGYMQSMSGGRILDEVNGHASEAALPAVRLSRDGWAEGSVSRLDQGLDRPDVPPSPFQLRHLWVDLRKA